MPRVGLCSRIQKGWHPLAFCGAFTQFIYRVRELCSHTVCHTFRIWSNDQKSRIECTVKNHWTSQWFLRSIFSLSSTAASVQSWNTKRHFRDDGDAADLMTPQGFVGENCGRPWLVDTDGIKELFNFLFLIIRKSIIARYYQFLQFFDYSQRNVL